MILSSRWTTVAVDVVPPSFLVRERVLPAWATWHISLGRASKSILNNWRPRPNPNLSWCVWFTTSMNSRHRPGPVRPWAHWGTIRIRKHSSYSFGKCLSKRHRKYYIMMYCSDCLLLLLYAIIDRCGIRWYCTIFDNMFVLSTPVSYRLYRRRLIFVFSSFLPSFLVRGSKISIPGTTVVPVPLFHVLDGKDPDDYVARVEPSSQGGRKVAEYLLNVMEHATNSTTCSGGGGSPVGTNHLAPPATAAMHQPILEAQQMADRYD